MGAPDARHFPTGVPPNAFGGTRDGRDATSPRLLVREIEGGEPCALLEQAFALRFRVYCNERRFLPAGDYPDGRETDRFDCLSTHFCAMDDEGCMVGAVRLIRPPRGVDLPLRGRCRLYESFAPPTGADVAEVSRLVVPRGMSRHLQARVAHASGLGGRGFAPQALDGGHPARSEIVLNLYRAIYRYSRRHGIRHWYAAMERSLVRALKRYAFEFERIGPDADYFGAVAPYLASLDELERRVGAANPALLRWFREG